MNRWVVVQEVFQLLSMLDVLMRDGERLHSTRTSDPTDLQNPSGLCATGKRRHALAPQFATKLMIRPGT